MAQASSIEWTDATWNPIRGCTRISEGCRHCYAERTAARFTKYDQPYHGLAHRVAGEARWTGVLQLVVDNLDEPLFMRRPRRIFVNSMSDLFHEYVPDAWIDRIFATMALAPQHTFQILTKRADRMSAYLSARNGMGNAAICKAINAIDAKLGNRRGALEMPLPNVWLGVSVEDQAAADARIPLLLETPAAIRFLSCEPLLGPLRVDDIAGPGGTVLKPLVGLTWRQTPDGMRLVGGKDARIDWVICGGESGPGARPMHPEWARALRCQTRKAETPFFFKQWGEYVPETQLPIGVVKPELSYTFGQSHQHYFRLGKKAAGRILDGRTWNEFPKVPA